jgi:hypothetical protein
MPPVATPNPGEQHAHRARMIGGKCRAWLLTEGVGFEPTVPQTGDSGFRDRAETAAMPHHN